MAVTIKTGVDLPLSPVRYVVVYPDRAEVTREVSVSLEAGENEVQLKNISKAIDKESVRVDGVGSASILEVSFQEIPVTKEEDDQTELKDEVTKLEEELSSINKKLPILMKAELRLKGKTDLLEQYTKSLVSSSKGIKADQLVERTTVDNVFTFMDTFERESIDMMEKSSDNQQEIKSLNKRKDEIRSRLSDLKPKLKKIPSDDDGESKKEEEVIKQTVIGILLAVKERGSIKLLVSYVVSNASWSPKYDLRVSSAERTMQVSYFGMIKQNTGEDWLDTKLSLSTASPSVGGTPPDLTTLCINLLHFSDAQQKERYFKANYGGDDDYDRLRPAVVPKSAPGMSDGALADRTSLTLPIALPPQAKINEGLTSSVFDINATASIPSDNNGHKVSVAVIDLKPTFEYETVPKLSQHAFLKAKVKNESQYPLLAGPANVFLDQTFVTKTTLSSVSPQEEFSCSLGVDPSVRVVYKPVSRFRGESGLINVSVNFTFCQVTEINNTRDEPTTIHFTDQIPLSRDDKLKVNLVEPVIAKARQGQPPPNPNLTAQNHVTWSIELKARETKRVVVRYTVEHPKNKEIEGL